MVFGKPELKNKKLLLGVSAALAISMAGNVLAGGSEDQLQLNISSKSADVALMELSKASGVQIVVPSSISQSKMLSGISGSFTIESALDAMLAGSGLAYEFLSDDSIVIKATDSGEQNGPEKEGKESEVDEEIVVTGTLLRQNNPATPVQTLTREDIDRLGVHSVEDIIRSLPQNFASLNNATSVNGILDDLNPSNTTDDLQGNSAANLRGLGADATLVLVDGKRFSGSAVSEGNFVSLNNIPASAIERVEVLTEGASSIYGSDAVGGVINFILRKDYVGATTSMRYEDSSTGSDKYSLSQQLGFGWDTGRAMFIVSRDEMKSVNTAKAGLVTRDHRSRGGDDFRDFTSSQPGVLEITGLGTRYFVSLPQDNDGTSFTQIIQELRILDFGFAQIPVEGDILDFGSFSGANITPNENIANDLTPESKNTSLYFNVDQEIADAFSLNFSSNYSVNETRVTGQAPVVAEFMFQGSGLGNVNFPVAPLPGVFQSVRVGYVAQREVDAGILPNMSSDTKQTTFNSSLGFDWDLSFRDWRVSSSAGYGLSQSEYVSTQYYGSVPLRDENGNIIRRDPDDPESDPVTLISILLSGDDSTGELGMLNILGNGSDPATGATLADFFGAAPSEQPELEQVTLDVKLEGLIANLAGGEMRGAIGAEYRQEELDYSKSARADNRVLDGLIFGDRQDNTDGIVNPQRDITALFTELSIPLISEGNALPGIQSLFLSLGARWEEYNYDDVPLEEVCGLFCDPENGTPDDPSDDIPTIATVERANRSFTNTSPKVALAWQPIEEVTLRGSWSEAFRAPRFDELVNATDNPFTLFRLVDPFAPGGPVRVIVPSRSGGNPNVKPELSTSTTFGIDWTPSFIDGLSASVTYHKVEFEDRIARINLRTFGSEFALRQPGVAERDADGNLTKLFFIPINISARNSESTDINVNYQFDNDFGFWDVEVIAVYTGLLEDVLVEGQDPVQRDGAEGGPERLKGRVSLGWQRENYGANLFLNYSSGYTYNLTRAPTLFAVDASGIGTAFEAAALDVESYTTVDVTGFYNMDSGWKLQGGIRNLQGESHFPFVNNRDGFDSSRVDTRGRVMYLEVKKEFEF